MNKYTIFCLFAVLFAGVMTFDFDELDEDETVDEDFPELDVDDDFDEIDQYVEMEPMGPKTLVLGTAWLPAGKSAGLCRKRYRGFIPNLSSRSNRTKAVVRAATRAIHRARRQGHLISSVFSSTCIAQVRGKARLVNINRARGHVRHPACHTLGVFNTVKKNHTLVARWGIAGGRSQFACVVEGPSA